MKYALLLHLLGVVIWIGGMFFAYLALRPAAVKVLEPPLRLALWYETLRRFFFWVWISVAVIYASGVHMLGSAYWLGSVPAYVLAMAGIASAMTCIFAFVYFVPFSLLKRAVADQDWKSGGSALNRIRQLVGTNLVLGLLTITVAVIGGLLA